MKHDNIKNYNTIKLDVTERICMDKVNTTSIIDDFFDHLFSDDPYDFLVLSGVGLYVHTFNGKLEYYDVNFCTSAFKPKHIFQKKRFAISSLFDKISFIIKLDRSPKNDLERIIFKAVSCAENIDLVNGAMFPLPISIPISAQTSYQHKELCPSAHLKLYVTNISLTHVDPPDFIMDFVKSMESDLTEIKQMVKDAKQALELTEQLYSHRYQTYINIKVPLLNKKIILSNGELGNIIKINSNRIFVENSEHKIKKFDIYFCMLNQSIQFYDKKIQEQFKKKSAAYNDMNSCKKDIDFLKSKIKKLEDCLKNKLELLD